MNQNLPTTKAPNALVLAFQQEAPRFLSMLPPTAPKERMQQFVMQALMNPELMKCTPQSVLNSIMKSAQVGLALDGVEAAVVPFKGTATFVAMFKGLLKLARRSDKIRQLWAEIVFESDLFEVSYGSSREINHTPVDKDRTDPDKVTAVYACARWQDGFVEFEVMTASEIERVQRGSPAQNGPWKTHWIEMAKKTALRRLCKRLPLPDEVLMALQEDEYDDEAPRNADVVDDGRKAPTTLQELAAQRSAAKAAQVPSQASVQPAAPQEVQSDPVAWIPPAGDPAWASSFEVIDSTGQPHSFRLEVGDFETWSQEVIGGRSLVLRSVTWSALRFGTDKGATVEAMKQIPKAAEAVARGEALSLPVQRLIYCLAKAQEPPEHAATGGGLFSDEPTGFEDPA